MPPCNTRRVEGPERFVQVHLLGLPVQARVRFGQHLQELTRELSLIRIAAQDGEDPSLPLRLLQIAAELDTTYVAFRAAPDAVIAAALAAGDDFCDVTYTVPLSAGVFVQGLGRVLEEADAFCRSEQLLSLPASQEVVAYRRWFVEESVRQLAGEEPRAWRPPAGTSFVPGPRPSAHSLAPRPGPRPDGVGESAGDLVGEPMVMESMASSVASARRYVRGVLRGLDAEDLEEAAELAVSELVTNAVLHARTDFSLAVRTLPSGRVRIEVRDSSPAPLQPRHFATTATTGRGLQLVASLSTNWGVEQLSPGPGKVVWFEPRVLDAEPLLDLAEWDLDTLL